MAGESRECDFPACSNTMPLDPGSGMLRRELDAIRLVMARDALAGVLEAITEANIRYARATLEAGADGFFFAIQLARRGQIVDAVAHPDRVLPLNVSDARLASAMRGVELGA